MRLSRLITGVVLGVSLVLTQAGSVFADDSELLALVKGLQKQIEAQNQTLQQQSQRIQQLESRGPGISNGSTSQLEKDVALLKRQQEVNQEVQIKKDTDFDKKVSDAIGGSDKWLKGLAFNGDLRLRYEAFHYNSGQPGHDPDRNRFRFRLRYGFEKTFNPEWKAGFSLAVSDKQANGTQTDPESANTTFTNNFDYKNIWVDKAYASYIPEWAKVGPVAAFKITAGKTDNPFERGSTDMIWKTDNVRPEGVYETADFNLYQGDNVTLKAYGTLGQFVLNEASGYGASTTNVAGKKDAELFAYQVGINPIFSTGLTQQPIEELSTLSVYSYPGYAGNANWKIGGATGTSIANGNIVSPTNNVNLDAGSFNVLSTYHEIKVSPFGVPVAPFVEVADNVSDHSTHAGIQDSNIGWSTGLKLGKVNKKGDWEANYAYKWIGANAVVGAFNDLDFGSSSSVAGQGGGTGRSGSVVKLGYGLTDFLKLNFSAYLVNELNPGYTNANNGGKIWNETVSRFQTDMTWKF